MSDTSHIISILEYFTDSLNQEKNNFADPSIWDKINDALKRSFRIESILDKSFKIPERQPQFPHFTKPGSFCDINDKLSNFKITDIIKVEFKRFYPNIICRLFEEGLLELNIQTEPYYYFVNHTDIKKHLSKDAKIVFNIYINYYFGKKLLPNDREKVAGRGYQIIEHFSNYNGWLYSDTDHFFIKDDIGLVDNLKKDLDLLELPYEIEFIKESVFLARKRYTYINQEGLGKIMGFRPKK